MAMNFRVTVAKPSTAKKARELERSSREPDSERNDSRLLHGISENSGLGPSHMLRHGLTPTTRKGGAERRGGRRNRRSEESTGCGNEYFSHAKTGSPAEAIEGVVKRIDLSGSDFFLRMKARKNRLEENQENREHGCSWSGSGWHSSAARIVTFRR